MWPKNPRNLRFKLIEIEYNRVQFNVSPPPQFIFHFAPVASFPRGELTVTLPSLFSHANSSLFPGAALSLVLLVNCKLSTLKPILSLVASPFLPALYGCLPVFFFVAALLFYELRAVRVVYEEVRGLARARRPRFREKENWVVSLLWVTISPRWVLIFIRFVRVFIWPLVIFDSWFRVESCAI